VWQDGQARVLVDAGGGSALRFGESGAKMSQLDVILFTHFHVDHSADFPSLIFSSWFEGRDRPLPVCGPAGSSEFPSTVDFVHAFFNRQGRTDPIGNQKELFGPCCICKRSRLLSRTVKLSNAD